MKKIGFPILALVFLALACQPKPTQPEQPAKEEKKQYFPVADYLKSEIRYVDSLPVGITLYSIRRGKKDSVFIKPREFDSLASVFLPSDLDSSTFARLFTENSFMDQTTQAITFTYAANTDSPALRRVDVLAGPNQQGFDNVKSIYMEIRTSQGDSSVIKKMFWKAKKGFQIITIAQAGDKPATTIEQKAVWDYVDQ